MVRILSLSFALAAFGMAVRAQAEDGSSSSVAPASSSTMSSAASTQAAASSSSMTSSASQPTGSSDDNDNDNKSQVCSILVGDPRVSAHDCTFSSTYTPPYDQSSIISYLIGSFRSAGPEATPVDVVATQLAGDVLDFYPTLTLSKAQLAGDFKDALSASIEAIRNGDQTIEDSAITNKALSYGAVFAAVIAGGAFVL